jgi:hypothetical protein
MRKQRLLVSSFALAMTSPAALTWIGAADGLVDSFTALVPEMENYLTDSLT